MNTLDKVYDLTIDIKNIDTKYNSYAKFFDDDRETSVIKVKILNNNSPIDLENCSVEAYFVLANNTYHNETCKIIDSSEGIVELQLCQKCLVKGENIVRLSILKDNEIANTPIITYEVRKGLYSDNPNFNDDPLTPILSQMLLDVKVTKVNQIELQERYEKSLPKIEGKIKEVESLINRVDTAIASGTQDLEVKEARVDKNGKSYAKLGDRLDEVDSQLDNITKPVISFCFDDGYSEDDLTYSIFKEFGLPCSFALVTDYSINRRSLDIYRKYSKEGFGINSHTCKHTNLNLDNITKATAQWEIEESKNKMQKLGFYANGLVASNSVIPDKFMDYVRENYDYAFTQYWGVVNSSNKGYINDKNYDLHKLGRVSLTHNSLDTIKSTIDECVENNGILFFYDHRTGYDDGTSHVTEVKLREILTYVKTLVDEDKVLVKNNDDAINYYFKKQLKNEIINFNTKNLAIPFHDYNRMGLEYDSWFLSVHEKDEGEKLVKINDNTIKINFPNGLSEGKENSMQLKIDISKLDMSNTDNQTISMSFKAWTDKEINADINANVRFYLEDGTTFDTTHTGNSVLISKENRSVTVLATVKGKDLKWDYAQVYWRLTNKNAISEEVNIYISEPSITFSNTNIINSGIPKSLKTYGVSKAKLLDGGFVSSNREWIHYTASEFTYDTFKNSELENGTIEILKDGLYYVGVMGYYKITGATANKRILFRVMPNNFNNDQLNRIISYYNGSDSVVNINGGQVLYLKKGDVLTVDLYFDSTTGTISELEAPQIRLCLINDLY